MDSGLNPSFESVSLRLLLLHECQNCYFCATGNRIKLFIYCWIMDSCQNKLFIFLMSWCSGPNSVGVFCCCSFLSWQPWGQRVLTVQSFSKWYCGVSGSCLQKCCACGEHFQQHLQNRAEQVDVHVRPCLPPFQLFCCWAWLQGCFLSFSLHSDQVF